MIEKVPCQQAKPEDCHVGDWIRAERMPEWLADCLSCNFSPELEHLSRRPSVPSARNALPAALRHGTWVFANVELQATPEERKEADRRQQTGPERVRSWMRVE